MQRLPEKTHLELDSPLSGLLNQNFWLRVKRASSHIGFLMTSTNITMGS